MTSAPQTPSNSDGERKGPHRLPRRSVTLIVPIIGPRRPAPLLLNRLNHTWRSSSDLECKYGQYNTIAARLEAVYDYLYRVLCFCSITKKP